VSVGDAPIAGPPDGGAQEGEPRAQDSAVPSPGTAVRGSRTGRPIMALLDLLGRRWALRVVWELRDGPMPFRALQRRCDRMSSSVLNHRIAELGAAGVVEHSAGGYRLSAEGLRLLEAFEPLQSWAERWERRTPRE
jgi:DNA-binding HxlR family transcriptional regulator